MNTIIIILCGIIAITFLANFINKRFQERNAKYEKKMHHFRELITEATDEELILFLIRSQEYQPEFVEMVKTELENVRNITSYKDFFNGRFDEELIEFCKQPKSYPDEFIELAKQELKERNITFEVEEPKPLHFMEQINCFQNMQKNPFEKTEQVENTETENNDISNDELNRTTKHYYMKRLAAYLRRICRLSVSYSKHENLVWKDLKKYSAAMEWNCGIYEKEKYIEGFWEIEDEKGARFCYTIYEGYFHCKVLILEGFPVELTTDIFILAAHFNNLLTYGVVRINVEQQFVEYHGKTEILVPLLYRDTIDDEINRFHNMSKEIFWAFQKLVEENEAPAIIFADLMKRIENKTQTQK